MSDPSGRHTAQRDEINVLHVDDEPDFARMVALNLEDENERFRLYSSTDPTEVTNLVETKQIDCVLSDYQMGQLDGIDVLQAVRNVDPELPFILFTDTGSESVASRAISAGISDYVIKAVIKDQYSLLATKIETAVDRRRTERVAHRTQQQLHELSEHTNDVLWIFSADWSELQYINSRYEELYGQSISTLRSNPQAFLRPVHPEDVDDLKTAMQQASAGQTQHVEYRVQADQERWVESHAEPIVDDEGTVLRVAGYTHEITHRKQREIELRAKNERLERFASIVSHDLRNPLSVADGYIELARSETDSDHLQTAARALDRMETLISELLTLAREGQEVTETKRIALDTLARSSWANVDQRQATLIADTDAGMYADKIRLGQIFENLFRNAVEHGGPDVTIRVDQCPDGDGFYIENDGEPIPADKQSQIFETGFTTNRQGTGFGLAIIKRIVSAHGWEIDVTDSPLGGPRFEITGVDLLDQHDLAELPET